MIAQPQPPIAVLTRRRVLQGTLRIGVGLLAWHQGWPHLRTALAQKGEPSRQMTWAIHVTIAPTWFDPAETPGGITPFMFLYALHDALVKPMPENPMSPCLATSWSESADGLTYDFALRQQFPKTRNSKHSSGILTCLFVNRHAKMELSGYE